MRSWSVAREGCLNVVVVVPTRLQDFIRGKSSKCAACRATSVFYRCVVYGKGLVGEDVLEVEFRINSLDAVHPKRYEAIEHGYPRFQNSMNAVLKVTRACECDCSKEIRVFDLPLQLGTSGAGQSPLRMSDNKPLLAEIRDRGVSCRYRVHDIGC